ncbi:MAG: asparagine synthase (glutamine-hydrolyzing) [Leptolinea sp.]|jgi:asparagine synthase (glutamine-hydrolysing)|nr:asparagine synthase (glutamine-hydrolyzing) [Leptolinea sp.]
MCGITGFLDTRREMTDAELKAVVIRMSDAIVHRGPDDSDEWTDASAGVSFGFRRLAIVDLTPTGRQPMISASGRYVMVFNGEIYNYGEMRNELISHGAKFRGTSDSEVMVEAIDAWGLVPSIKRFNGQFAFALWDRKERVLHLVRDRVGVKPMYYGWFGKILLFGSELKCLRAFPGFSVEIDRDALALFVRHNYIPAPYSIYQNVYKQIPGTILSFPFDRAGFLPEPEVFWSARGAVEAGLANPFTGTLTEAEEQLDALLRESVRLRMMADVPLGAFLSGGVDSSTIVALMQAESSRPVKTFTIGFYEDEYNEAEHARKVAAHLKTEHTELMVTPQEAQAVIPKIPALYDEPFSDSSQIPTYLVSWMTRQHVTVSLSGDGGDELFAGYNRYFWGNDIWSKIGWMGSGLRGALAGGMRVLSPNTWDGLFRALKPVIPASLRVPSAGEKMIKMADVVSVDSPQSLYYRLVSHWKDPDQLVRGGKEPLTPLTDRSTWPNIPDFTRWMMYMDLITYLPDDILAKVDRASMGVSLEARVPYLDDHRVIEFAWRLPMSMKIQNGQGKWILRNILYKYVPRELIERPKMGFGIPINTWLRGPLRDWAEDLLDEQRMRAEGFFDPEPVQKMWREHLAGTHNNQYYLWDILVFQEWLRAQVPRM